MFHLNIIDADLVLDAYLQKYFVCIKFANGFDNYNLLLTLRYTK